MHPTALLPPPTYSANPNTLHPRILLLQGVRSVVLHEQLLSFGTGQGKLAFVDVRTWQPLDLGV